MQTGGYYQQDHSCKHDQGSCMPLKLPYAINLASFPGLPIIQFLIACSMQKWRKKGDGRPGPFYHVNDVSVYLGRQKGEGSPIKRISLRPYLLVSAPAM